MVDADTPQEIPRLKDGRPLITPIDGGKPQPYTRCSTFARALDDGAALVEWKQRILLKACLEHRQALPHGVDAMDYRGPAGGLLAELMHLGGGDDAANFGTACHALSDMLDFQPGKQLRDHYDLDPEYWAWIDRYHALTRLTHRLDMVEGEVFVVNDRFKCAGTLDRLVRLPDDHVIVADTKTGNTLHKVQFAIQMALYATAQRYDPTTGARSPLHPDLDQSVGLVVHVPRGKNGDIPQPALIPVDLRVGLDLAELALTVRRARSTDTSVPADLWRAMSGPQNGESK